MSWLRHRRGLLLLVVVFALGWAANGHATITSSSWGGAYYDLPALCGLLALGAYIERGAFERLWLLPQKVRPRLSPAAVEVLRSAQNGLCAVGRRPLTWYAGHVLVLAIGARLAGVAL